MIRNWFLPKVYIVVFRMRKEKEEEEEERYEYVQNDKNFWH